MHDLACFVEHLHLLLGISVVGEDINLRDDVIRQLVREFLHLHRLVVHQLTILLLQLCHGSCTCARCALVAGDVYALDVAELLQRLQHYHHHNSGAVRIGDDTARTLQSILGIALRHYQWYIVAHAERRRVVDHHCAVLSDSLGILLRGATTSRCERNVDVLEIVVVLQELHLILLTFERVFLSSRTLRTKQH